MLEEALLTEPTNSRYQFYLAQSYFDSQQWDKATEAYLKRVDMGGWEEECYYSLFRVALVAMSQQKPWQEIQERLLNAYDFRPCRAEPLHIIARYYRLNNKPRLAHLFAKQAASIPYPAQDILFIDTNIYKWMCIDEVAATAFYVREYALGQHCCRLLLQENRLPPSEVERTKANLATYDKAIEEIAKNNPHVSPPALQHQQPQAKPYIQKRTFKQRRK